MCNCYCMQCINKCFVLNSPAFNAKSSTFVRGKFKQKLAKFKQLCELIEYLGKAMSLGYIEPLERPAEFDERMETFLALSQSSNATTSLE